MDRRYILKKTVSTGIVLCLLAVLFLSSESKEQIQGELQSAWSQTNAYQAGHYRHRFFYLEEENRLEDHYQRKEGTYNRDSENENMQILYLKPDFEKYTISRQKNKNGETMFLLKAPKETLEELRQQCITNFYIMEEQLIESNGITGYFFDEGVSISELSQQDIRQLKKEESHELRQLELSQFQGMQQQGQAFPFEFSLRISMTEAGKAGK